MERKLASIQKIETISPIENADKIVQTKVLGWIVVTKKEEFSVGDLCVYFEIDSVLPDHPEFAFLKKNNKEIRLKTVKLRGVISQGLALPINILEQFDSDYHKKEYSVGDDVTEIIGIKKYTPPSSVSSNIVEDFPDFVPKTDQMRLQSCPELLGEIKGKQCYITEKLDGTSATYIYYKNEFSICSRNCLLQYQENNCLWSEIQKKYEIKDKLQKLGKDIAIQGEICGPSIQGNKLGLPEISFFVFSIFDIDQQKYLSYPELVEISKSLNLETVPILNEAFFLPEDVENYLEFFLKLAEGKYPKSQKEREGIVVAPVENTHSPTLQAQLSFKVISNKFLLKNKDE